MYFGQARIDFPSDALLRKPTLGERLLRRLNRPVELGTGFGVLSVGTVNLLSGFGEAFSALGIQNVVTLVADGRVLYADAGNTEDDLASVIERAARPDAVGEEFERLSLVTRLRGVELEFVFELEVRREALLTDAEATLSASAVPRELTLHHGEGPRSFAERLGDQLAKAPPEQGVQHFNVRLEAVAQTLGDIFAAQVTKLASVGQVHMPTVREIVALETLDFSGPLAPHRREEPQSREEAPSPDPVRRYFVDPTRALREMLLVDAIVDGRWVADSVFVVDSHCRQVFRSDEVPDALPWREVGRYVALGEQRVRIDPAFNDLKLALGEPQAGRDPHPVYARFHEVGFGGGAGKVRSRGTGPAGGRMGGLLGF